MQWPNSGQVEHEAVDHELQVFPIIAILDRAECPERAAVVGLDLDPYIDLGKVRLDGLSCGQSLGLVEDGSVSDRPPAFACLRSCIALSRS